eukprot:362298-Chlamydomonas_euryale.AAC.2
MSTLAIAHGCPWKEGVEGVAQKYRTASRRQMIDRVAVSLGRVPVHEHGRLARTLLGLVPNAVSSTAHL